MVLMPMTKKRTLAYMCALKSEHTRNRLSYLFDKNIHVNQKQRTLK